MRFANQKSLVNEEVERTLRIGADPGADALDPLRITFTCGNAL